MTLKNGIIINFLIYRSELCTHSIDIVSILEAVMMLGNYKDFENFQF